MGVRASSTLGGLARDLESIAGRVKPECAATVSRSVRQGEKLSQGIAKRAAGPHGTNYYKRITSEMTGPLQGEYGPTGDVAGNAVGAGWRHGVNTDLPKSADIIGPRFARDVDKRVDRWFW